MAHFAELDENGAVLQVLVVHNNDAPDEASGVAFLNSLFGEKRWVQTSYNGNIRKNFASVGDVYDAELDAFIPRKPTPDAVFNRNTCKWSSDLVIRVLE